MTIGAWKVGSTVSGTSITSDISQLAKPLAQHKSKIQIFHSSGGIKKDFWVEQNNNDLVSFQFETNYKGMGAGTIALANVDFPLDPDDTIKYFYDGDLIYEGIIDTVIDPKGGNAKIQPRHIRYNEILYNGSFTSKTIKEILQTIVEAKAADTGIGWNVSFIDIDDTDTFTLEWIQEPVKKIIDSLVEKLDDRFWGVNENQTFFVKTPDTVVSKLYLQNAAPSFTNLSIKRDYTKIKATRYQVFRKSGASTSETTYAGGVGYDTGSFIPGTNYPTLAIEKLTRKREKKLTLSDIYSTNGEAKDFAYAKLLAETITPTTGTLTGIEPDDHPNAFELIKAEDYEEQQLFIIEDCDATNGFDVNWSLDTDNFVEGTGSVEFTSDSSALYDRQYDYGSIYRADEVGHISQLGFMVRSTVAGDYLFFSTGEDLEGDGGTGPDGLNEDGLEEDYSNSLWDTEYQINIANSNQWFYFSIPWPADFRYLGWRTKSQAATVNIDRIQLFGYNKNIIETNVVKTTWKIDRNGVVVDATLNQVDLQANDSFFLLEKEAEKLKTITKGT